MRAEVTQAIVEGLNDAGINFVSYLPESWLHDVYDALIADDRFEVILGTNEGECVSMCAGAWLGGRKAAVVFENSGLRVAAETLARLGIGHGIPVLMIMPFRGDLGDKDWWAQPHGHTLIPMLEALGVRYRVVRDDADVRSSIVRGWETLHSSKSPVAIVLGAEVCQ
jgi:sulfopyruvate decarboxylase subunit alpha